MTILSRLLKWQFEHVSKLLGTILSVLAVAALAIPVANIIAEKGHVKISYSIKLCDLKDDQANGYGECAADKKIVNYVPRSTTYATLCENNCDIHNATVSASRISGKSESRIHAVHMVIDAKNNPDAKINLYCLVDHVGAGIDRNNQVPMLEMFCPSNHNPNTGRPITHLKIEMEGVPEYNLRMGCGFGGREIEWHKSGEWCASKLDGEFLALESIVFELSYNYYWQFPYAACKAFGIPC